MAKYINFANTTIYHPGVYTRVDLTDLANQTTGITNNMVIIGESSGGEPLTAGDPTTVHKFTDYQSMRTHHIDGNLADAAAFAFSAGVGHVDGLPVRGAQTVYTIKTNASTAASYNIADAVAATQLTITDLLYGPEGNFTYFTVTAGVAGGLVIACGRTRAPNQGTQTSPELGKTGYEWFTLTYTGVAAAATVTIDQGAGTIAATTTGAVDDFSITLANYPTMRDLCAYIDSLSHWTCVVKTAYTSSYPPTGLNEVAAYNVKLAPYEGKGMVYEIVKWLNENSMYVSATQVDWGTPTTYTQTYLAGGTLGTTNGTALDNALALARNLNVRSIVIAWDDDTTGALTIEDTVTKLKTHLNACNAVNASWERVGFLGNNESSKANILTLANGCNSEYICMCAQHVKRVGADGTTAWFSPWAMAVMLAGIKAGCAVGTPLTYRYLDCYDIKVRDSSGWTVEDDLEDMTVGGITIAEKVTGKGIRVIQGITTYLTSDNDGYQDIAIVETWLQLKRSLRLGLEDLFIGTKTKGALTIAALKARIQRILDDAADLTNPDYLLVNSTDESGNVIPAYRNLTVVGSGDSYVVNAEVTLVNGIKFILNNIYAKQFYSVSA